ncbi:MAG: hypothetical protein OXF61_16255 [Acidimicrobiaceae bacterium]|nr:hypothetical protein [Acidimicrobiaceae bacterium]
MSSSAEVEPRSPRRAVLLALAVVEPALSFAGCCFRETAAAADRGAGSEGCTAVMAC